MSSPLSEEELDLEPRRGGRARKVVDRFVPNANAGASNAKRKQNGPDVEGDEHDEVDEEEEDDDEEEAQPQRRTKRAADGTQKSKANGQAKQGTKRVANGHTEAVVVDGADGIKTDCPLFNALLSPDIALQPLIEDWVETYQQTANDEVSERASVHELVLFSIRCCGLSAEIEESEALDADGARDVLETIQDETVKTSLAAYPLISKAKVFRSFRTNLAIFIPHLISTLSLCPCLYETSESTNHSIPIIPLLFNWLHLMSSSPLRPIRHTSTYLSLKLNSALCDVAAGVSKDLSLKQRQREAEARKGATGAAAHKRLKEAEVKVKDAHEKKTRLEEYMQETFDVVFVHRVRDADPAIRTDCLKELGVWVKKYPEKYIATGYLTYFTRGCNDPYSHARLETVKALSSLFAKDTFINNARTVTLRLTPRIIEMALRDVDLSVRVTALSVIAVIDKTGILQDEDEEPRDKVARLMFDHEPRVRKAVGGFVHGMWEEKATKLKTDWAGARGSKKKRGAGIVEGEMNAMLEWKALATLLVDTANALEGPAAEASTSKQSSLVPASSQSMTRATAAVEAIWERFEALQEWEKLVDYLLLDHSTAEQDMWLLNDDEEDFVIQVLIACIKKEDKEDQLDARTKTLMKILPRLFTKHQADTARMAGILSIPEHMNLGVYLDMRKSSAYDSLWDDVIKQFLQHTESTVLSAAIQAINHLCNNSSMAGSNGTKLAELEETLFTSLRDAIDGEDVFTMSLDEDRLAGLESILLRVVLLERSRDMVEVMEDVEGGQSSGWDIICAFAERGDVGYKEEAKMVEYALQIVFLHMTWLFKRFTANDADDEGKKTVLAEKRDRAVEIYQKLSLRERTNAAETVRRQAFISFINMHVLFSKRSNAAAAQACPMAMADEIQHRLGGAFQAGVERYALDLEDADLDFEDGAPASDEASLQKAQQEFVFLQLVSVFVGAVRCGVLEVEHAKEPLAHIGRFSATYDAVAKKLIDVLRDEGIYNKEAITVQHVAASAVQTSFSTFLDTDAEEPSATMSLVKVIASAFIVHGTHFSILKQIHPSDVYDFHITALDYIARKILGFVKQEKSTKSKDSKARAMKKRFQALSFFRVLLLLLGPVTGKDALRIKSHLEEAITSTEAPISVNKSWDAYRVYEKRLLMIASKDPNVKTASKRVAAEAEDEDGSPAPALARKSVRQPVLEHAVEEEEDDDDDEASPAPTATTRTKVRQPAAAAAEAEEEDGEEELGIGEDDSVSPAPTTPAKRPLVIDDEPLFEPMADVDMNVEMDFDLDLSLAGSQESRARSVSIEPTAKKRRTVKRF